jgi:hypothetical protein
VSVATDKEPHTIPVGSSLVGSLEAAGQFVVYLRKCVIHASNNTVTSDTFRRVTVGCIRLHLCLIHHGGCK